MSTAVVACAFALAVAPSAFGHAALITTSPSAGQVLEHAPGRVVLRYDEAVSTVPGSVRVYDGDAKRVDDGRVTTPADDTVSVTLPAGLPDGTYTVAWRVLSADSHPIRGAFVFSVREPVGAGVADRVLDAEGRSGRVDAVLAVTRFVGLVLILLCFGGVFVGTFVIDAPSRPVWSAVAACAVVLAADSLAWAALTGAQAAGLGLEGAVRWPLVRDVLETGFGRVWVARAALCAALAVLAVLARHRSSRPVLLAAMTVAAAIAVTPALSGHAHVAGGLAVLGDALHVLAAGVWVGGLAFLALVLVMAGGDRWSLAARIVPRFSTYAVAAVAVLVVSGTVGTVLEVHSWSALVETTYGRLILAKVALLLALVALGAYNNRVSVPRLRATDSGRLARHRFARLVAGELALMATVVAVTAILVAQPPAKAQATAGGVVSREGLIGPYRYTLTADPAGTGTNEIHVYLLDATGALAPVDEIAVSAALPAVDVGPLRFRARPAGPGHGIVTAAELPLAGDWQLQLDVRKGEFDQWSTTIDIPIRKDS